MLQIVRGIVYGRKSNQSVMDYWLNPTIQGKPPAGRKMTEVSVPPTREHVNTHFLTWPTVPRQQHAVENFVVREQTRLSHHTRQ